MYGNQVSNEVAMTASSDAYYLLHNISTAPSFSELIKLDLDGNMIWSKMVGDTSTNVECFRIKYDNNSLLLTGVFLDSLNKNFVAKLDTAANILWSTEIDYGGYNINTRIQQTSSGYSLIGMRDSNSTFDITLTRIDTLGNCSFNRAYSYGANDFTANAAAEGMNGLIRVAGNFAVRPTAFPTAFTAVINQNGFMYLLKSFESNLGNYYTFTPTDMISTSDSNFIVTGFTSNPLNNHSMAVFKIDALNNIIWGKSAYSALGNTYGKTVLEDSHHNIVVAGPTNNVTDQQDFILKFDLSGNLISTAAFTHTSTDQYYFPGLYYRTGQDLMERNGVGYTYSLMAEKNYNENYHALFTINYNGTTGCSNLDLNQQFTLSNLNWYTANFQVFPTLIDQIDTTTIQTIFSSSNTNITDLCNLVDIQDKPKEEYRLELYPNPSTDWLTCSWQQINSGPTEFILYDFSGKKIRSYTLDQSLIVNGQFKLNTQQLTKGLYLIELIFNGSVHKGKFSKL